MSAPPATRFAVVGLDHPHVFGMVQSLVAAGGELAAWHQPGASDGNAGLAPLFAKGHPRAESAPDVRRILDDDTIALVVCAGVNTERAAAAVQAMQHGKDVLADKPGATTLAQLDELRRVHAETGRRFTVYFSERLENPATVRASELVAAGAIGRVLQTVGLGPHRLGAPARPPWFFDPVRYGGILCDLASHQIDQFLHFTGTESASIVAARVANHAHPEYSGFDDFGEVLLEGDGCSGYVRVDWFTPDGLPTWGDGRLTLLGTDGFIEVRKNVDLARRDTGNYLFLVDGSETRREDCNDVALPFARQLLDDVANRTETALPQQHCFRVTELALRAQQQAQRLPGYVRP